jgi:DNA-binding NarL/FixJ family response regulator
VVFVDDDELVLKAVARLFQFQPYEAVTFSDPSAALDYIRENPVQVLVSDLRMPEIDGLELLRRAQAEVPEVVRVVLSAYSDRESLLDAINTGNIYRYILKPWDAVELISVVRQSSELYNLRRENQRLAEAMRGLSVHDLVSEDLKREPRGVMLLERYGAYVASELSAPVGSFREGASLSGRVASEQKISRNELMRYVETVENALGELENIRRDLVDDTLLLGLARDLDLDLNTAVQRVAEELKESRGELELSFREELADYLPAVVSSPILLSRLLTELLTFALDHAPRSGVLTLRTLTVGDHARYSLDCPFAISTESWRTWYPLLDKLARSNGGVLSLSGAGSDAARAAAGRGAAASEEGSVSGEDSVSEEAVSQTGGAAEAGLESTISVDFAKPMRRSGAHGSANSDGEHGRPDGSGADSAGGSARGSDTESSA